MMNLVISKLISMFAGGSTRMIVIVALFTAALGWGFYGHMNSQRLQAEVNLYMSKAEHAVTLDEINKQTARSNEALLTSAIEQQNSFFAKLSDWSTENNRVILFKLQEQQNFNAQQYKQINHTIEQMDIQTCQGLVDALIAYPRMGDDK